MDGVLRTRSAAAERRRSLFRPIRIGEIVSAPGASAARRRHVRQPGRQRFECGEDVTQFAAAVVAFIVSHAILPRRPIRERLLRSLGRRGYFVAYSVLSTVLLLWLVVAARNAPYVQLWAPAPWQALVPSIGVPLALWLLVMGVVEPNPLSMSLRRTGDGVVGPVARITRHPILWAFLLWAACHVPANGDVVSVIMFGSLALLAAAGFVLVDQRIRRRLGGEAWGKLAGATSIVPFAAILAGRARFAWTLLMTVWAVVAVGVSAWFLVDGHRLLVGGDPGAWLGF